MGLIGMFVEWDGRIQKSAGSLNLAGFVLEKYLLSFVCGRHNWRECSWLLYEDVGVMVLCALCWWCEVCG